LGNYILAPSAKALEAKYLAEYTLSSQLIWR
jgi:hypothetical protein